MAQGKEVSEWTREGQIPCYAESLHVIISPDRDMSIYVPTKIEADFLIASLSRLNALEEREKKMTEALMKALNHLDENKPIAAHKVLTIALNKTKEG